MSKLGDYFFCGIGGSGMTPLALIIQARGGRVEGSDRALDQGRNSERFDFLRARGMRLYPQDGSGITRPEQILVASTAVEETVPDVQAARREQALVQGHEETGRIGGRHHRDIQVRLLDDARLNHRCEVVEGVAADASAALLRAFFRGKRSGGAG